MELVALYNDHIDLLKAGYSAALAQLQAEGTAIDGVLLHSGSDAYYFADDQHIAFRSVSHFAHWLPLEGPDHFLLFKPGAPLRLIRYVPFEVNFRFCFDYFAYFSKSI